MSKALLKRCMELVTETPTTKSKNAAKNTNKTHKGQQNRSAGVKTSKRCNKITASKEDSAQAKRIAAKKLTVRQVQKRLNNEKDRTELNVKRLLAMDRSLQLTDETKELMLKRARTGHYVIPEKVEKEEEDVFTKEDFEKFEREYFPH